jgi:hypothetical protein
VLKSNFFAFTTTTATRNVATSADTPPDKEGWLWKRGEVNKAFQKRYFVLKGNLLFYFEKQVSIVTLSCM